jgi:hypothetical protein
MNINVDSIKNYFQMGYQFAIEQGGKLGDYSIQVLKQALDHIKQDSHLAGATVVVSNIFFLETALLITNLVNQSVMCLFGSEDKCSERAILAHSFAVLTINVSLIIGMNVALYQGLRLPVKPFVTAAISTATCTSYILFRLFRANANGAKDQTAY